MIFNKETVRPLDDKVLRGGYATIQRVCIEGGLNISAVWEFAAKRPFNHEIRLDLARVDHKNKSLALRIAYSGVICFVAIHHKDHEGYMHWWIGVTLREMFRRDPEVGENVYVPLVAMRKIMLFKESALPFLEQADGACLGPHQHHECGVQIRLAPQQLVTRQHPP